MAAFFLIDFLAAVNNQDLSLKNFSAILKMSSWGYPRTKKQFYVRRVYAFGTGFRSARRRGKLDRFMNALRLRAELHFFIN